MNIDNITVFTDASFCPETKAAGGAFWARNADTKFSSSFRIEDAESSADAEILTACRSIQSILEHPVLGEELKKGKETRLILVVDCLTVKHVLEGGKAKMGVAACQAVATTRIHVFNQKFWFKVNHVKGHSGIGSPRQWVNNWCDKEARHQMYSLRDVRRVC